MAEPEQGVGTSPKMISVSLDYLAFLHDELAENQARLRDLLGESQSQTIFCWSADKLVTTVEPGKYDHDPLEGISKKFSNWGMEVSKRSKGSITEIEVKCPYAEEVHSRMVTREPKCPLGEYVLGACRLEESKSQLLHNEFTKTGVRFTVESPKQVNVVTSV